MLRNRGVITQDTIRWLYAPILWLSRSWIIERLLEWYLQWWV